MQSKVNDTINTVLSLSIIIGLAATILVIGINYDNEFFVDEKKLHDKRISVYSYYINNE